MELETLQKLIVQGEIDTVIVCIPDIQGRLVGKRVTGHFFLDHASKEVHVCDYLLATDMEMEPAPGYGAASWEKGYGDFAIVPDLSSLRPTPWLPKTALVIGDCLDHSGNLLEHAPRSVLKRQLDRLAKYGVTAKMGSELEFYLFDDSFELAHEKRYRKLKTAGWYSEDYHVFQTTKEEHVIRDIRNGMEQAGIPVEFSKGEWGPGQEEINLRFAEALEMADRHTIYKNGVKEIALAHNKAVTFMAKWNNDLAGSSCHIHCSLWRSDDDSPVFWEAKEPHGLSKTARWFLAGQLKLASEMTYFLAPFINSYKRFQTGSFAPTKAIWSVDNRTAGFRVIGQGASLRIENRIPGADVNPYLAYAAILAAGLYGIENELPLEAAVEGNAYATPNLREIPKTLREAVSALEKSTILRDALGDAVIKHYVHAARWEQKEADRVVTDWDLVRGFERA